MTAAAVPPIPTTDALLRALVDATATTTGQEFFHALTRVLATTLNASNVALSQLSPGRTDQVETLSCFADGRHTPNFSYLLDTTPCKDVLGKTFTHHPERVAELFPDDHFFAETNTKSYMGVPLATPDNKPLGLMTLCHDHPTPHLAHLRDVLTLFAGRAAAEINRLHAEHSLRATMASLDQQVRDRTAALRHEVDQHAATEHDLRVSRQRYAAILNSQQTFVARCDPTGRVTYLNDAHARAFDLKLGDRFSERVHPDDRPALDALLVALASPPHHVTAEHRWWAHGQWRHVLWHASGILDDAGRVAEVQGVGFDITDRKLAERDLATVTGQVPSILWQSDADGLPGWEQDVDGRQHLFRWQARIIDEQAAQRVLPLDVPAGASYWGAWNVARHPEDADAIFASTAQALIMGLPRYSREFRCFDRTGQARWLHEEIAVQRRGPANWQLFGVVTDVTPRKVAELALRESEQRFRAMADSAPVMIWLTDRDDRTAWYNKPWRDFIGLQPEPYPAHSWEGALHPDDRERCAGAYREHFAARTPCALEYRLRRHDGAYRWVLDHAVPRRNADGSFAGFIGSCVDITDRKRAELDLATVTGRVPCILWRSTLTGLPGWQDDAEGQRALFRWDLTIIDEHAAQSLLPIEVPPGLRYRDVWGKHLHPDDRAVLRRTTARAILAGQPNYDREYRVTDRHGVLHWFHEDVFVEPQGPGRWVLFGVVTDVTPHKLAELAVRESQARYDFAARAGRVGIWDWDIAGNAIYLSANLKALLGYPPEFPLEEGPTWHEHLHPDDVQRVRNATEAHFDGRTPVYELEVRRRHRDGSWRWFLSRGTATRDPVTGEPVRMIGSLTDITDRKVAEDALRESESRYALATTYGRVGIWEWHIPSETLHLSDSLKAILGYAPGELAGMDRLTWRNHLHPDDVDHVLAVTDSVLAGRVPGYELEVRRRHKDGSWRWILSRASLTRHPATGRPLRMTGVVTDITARKLAEQALRESDSRYTLATQFGRVGVWEWHIPSDTIHLSDSLKALLGYAPHELNVDRLGWRSYLHPEDLPRVLAATESLAEGRTESYELEVRRQHRDGTYRWFNTRASVTRDSVTNGPLRMAGALTDITDRKRAQEALRTSEQRYAVATDAGRVGVWEYDVASGAFLHSPNSVALLGYGPDELRTHDAWVALVHPDDRAAVVALNNDPAAMTFELEIRRRHKDGTYRWFLSRGTVARAPDGRPLRLTGAHTDITDRKRADEALRTSESRYALATHAGGVGIWEYDVDADALYLSPNLPAMLGYARGEIRDMRMWRGLIHPDDLPGVLAANEDPSVTKFESEVRRRHKDGTYRWLLTRGTKTRDATGRLVRITGTHTDITDRISAEQALRASESRYTLATHAGRVGTWEYDVDADALYLSPNLPPMLGYDPGELTTFRAWIDLVHPDDLPIIRTEMNDLAATTFEMEIRRRHKDGSWRWLSSRGHMTRDPVNRRLTRITGTFTDITDRKRDQEALRESEARYALATEAGAVGIWEADYATGAVYVSPRLAAMLGRREGELSTLDAWYAITHPEDAVRTRAMCKDPAVRDYEIEIRHQHADGSWRWFLSRGTIDRGPDGVTRRITGTLTDITDRKRAEDALRESQHRFDIAVAAGRVGIIDWDIPSDRLFISPALKVLLGFAEHELPNDHDLWRSLLHPDDIPRVRAHTEAFLSGRSAIYELEVRRRHKDGVYRWFLARGTVARDPDGTPQRFTATLTDITDRKRAEDALRESQRRYALATEAGGVGIWDHDYVDGYFYLSPNLKTMLGYRADELTTIDAWQAILHPDDRATVHVHNRECHDTTFELEVRRRHKDGSYRWFISRGLVAYEPVTGRRTRITGVLADITDRKRADEALRASEEHFRTVLEQSPLATFIFSPEGEYVRSNQAAVDMYGFAPGELRGYNVFADPVLDGTGIQEAYAAAREGQRSLLPEAPVTPDRGRLKGEIRWIRGSVYPLRDPATGTVHALVAINEDVTERKRVEQALLSSERRFRKLVEQSPLSTQFFAPDGTMRSANGAWERLFGVTVDQLAGQYNLLQDPQLVERGIMPILRRAFDGEPVSVPTIPYVPPFGDYAGQERWCSALIFPVKDAAGRIEEVVLIHHDMTDQKRAEDALRAAADSNRRLLLELDHRVRNNLAGLQSLASLMRDRASTVDDFAAAMDARLRAMSHVHHLLSESRWQDLDLRSLLSSFLSHTRHLTPYPTPVHLDGPLLSLPAPLALPLTMILTEFLTNSAKYGAHSCPAGRVSLNWSLAANASGSSNSRAATLVLNWVESDGPAPIPNPVPSLGSALIESFSTRELAGSCTLTYPPSGASHTLSFPLA